jgi:hypothetical protein
MALVGHADANRHALLNTRRLPVYSTSRLCQQTQTLNLLVVVQAQCTMGCAADEQMRAGLQRLKTRTFGQGSKPQQKIIGPRKLTEVGFEADNLTP